MELITGNTYPVREQMRSLGGSWAKHLQGWLVPTANAEKARAIVAAARRSLDIARRDEAAALHRRDTYVKETVQEARAALQNLRAMADL